MPDRPLLDERLLRRLHQQAGAEQWRVSTEVFGESLRNSLTKAFSGSVPEPAVAEKYLSGLHLADLALAAACAAGDEDAWQHFITTFRPVLYRTADAIAPGGDARDLADGLYGELFGIGERGNARASLFRYYHGRSSLATWLRSVLSQRHIDRIRERKRTEPLPDDESAEPVAVAAVPPAPERGRYLALMRAALTFALMALAPRDRLRLACYYARQMTLAQVGRLLDEHEATVSRHVARSRRDVRASAERYLVRAGLVDAEIGECFRSVASDPGDLDLRTLLDTSENPGLRKETGDGRSMGEAV